MTLTPVEPPYDTELSAALARWMPPGSDVEPLLLFRVLAQHRDLFDRMRPLGAGILGRGLLPARVRELLILRTSARAGAGYEWGVHAARFAPLVGLTAEQLRSTALGTPHDGSWSETWDGTDRLVLEVADSLHDIGEIAGHLVPAVEATFDQRQVLEMVVCCGWYRTLAGVIKVAGLVEEPWGESFPEGEPARP